MSDIVNHEKKIILDVQMSVAEAFIFFEETSLQYKQLPVCNKEKFIGMLDEAQLDNLDTHQKLAEIELNTDQFAGIEDNLFSKWLKIIENSYEHLALLNNSGELEGVVSKAELTQQFLNQNGLTDLGAIFILRVRPIDYSLTKIAQILENERAIIRLSLIAESKKFEELLVILKVDCYDISTVHANFERYKYIIHDIISKEEYDSNLKEHYDTLMNYLNV